MKRLMMVLVSLAVLLTGCQFDGAYDLPLPGQQVAEDEGYVVTADFTDVVNVVPRTLVMANDVPVGQVTEVERVGWHARVTMRVRDDIELPANAVADVRQTSLLGEKYIALLEPTEVKPAAARLKDGDFIPLSRTARNPEVEEVLGALSFLLSGGGVGQLKTISHELNEMMTGRDQDLRSVLRKLNTLVGTLDEQKEDIISAMEAVNRLARTLNREKDVIGDALDAMGPALKVLRAQHDTLMKMLRELDRLGEVGTRVIEGSRENIVASLRHLRPALREFAKAEDSLPRGLSLMASFPFPEEAANLAKGDYANALFKMKFDLDRVVSSVLDGGGDTGLPNLINLCSATPLAPACEQINGPTKDAICMLDPTNLLCDRKPGDPAPIIPDVLGGLTGSAPSSSAGASGGTSGGLLSGLLGGGR